MTLTLEQFNQLDPAILTRAIAEECDIPHYLDVTGWPMKSEGGFLAPLTSIDDAVMVVEKLKCYQQSMWVHFMAREGNDGGTHGHNNEQLLNLINAPASLRMLALCNTVPEILVRYKELGGV